MSKELIPIKADSSCKRTVNARDLHGFLESKQDFSTWIKSRIKQYGFLQDVDFIPFHNSVERAVGGAVRIEYHLSIDMAKELSMVERNEKGKQARQYFIECEKIAKETPEEIIYRKLNDKAFLRSTLLTYTEKVIALESTIEEQKPKVDALDRISTADGDNCITDTAKILQMRPKDLFMWLNMNEWIYKRAGGKNWIAYQRRIQQGLLTHKVSTVSKSDGSEKTVEQVLVTPKGLTSLATKIAIAGAMA